MSIRKQLLWSVALGVLLLALAACGVLPAGPNQTETAVATPTLAAGVTIIDSGTLVPPPTVELPDMGLAPDITNEIWLNSEPMRLSDLRGKVVLVEFWTFG